MLLAEAWIHDLDPFLVEFSDGIGLRWYGLSYIAGFLVAWLLLRLLAGSRRTALRPEMVGDLLLSCVVGVLVGGLRRARLHGGRLVLAAANDRVRQILEITGLDTAFQLADAVEGVVAR